MKNRSSDLSAGSSETAVYLSHDALLRQSRTSLRIDGIGRKANSARRRQ